MSSRQVHRSPSLLRGPKRDTRAYHANAPVRGSSFMSEGLHSQQQTQVESDEQNMKHEQEVRSESDGTTDSQLFSDIPWGIPDDDQILADNKVDEDHPRPPSRENSINSASSFPKSITMVSEGMITFPKEAYDVAPGGYVGKPKSADDMKSKVDKFMTCKELDETEVLAIANFVDPEDEDDKSMYKIYAYEYDDDSKSERQNAFNRYFLLFGCFLIAVIAVGAIVVPLVIQSSRGPGKSVSNGPTSSPSTTLEGIYIDQLSAIVGIRIMNDDSHLAQAANWIMTQDSLITGPYDPFLLQRFILATFYMATTNNGRKEWRSCNPPSDNDGPDCNFEVFAFESEDGSFTYDIEPSFRWLSGVSECTWAGVVCFEGIVQGIELGGNNMTGTLPIEISFLPQLQSISFHYNNFEGGIPVQYATIRNLVNLELHGNQLTGSIPIEMYGNRALQLLNLGENLLTGTVSTHIGQLTSLKGFHVGENALNGTIPSEIGRLGSLSHTRWNKNHFVGTIPNSLSDLSNLVELWLQGNLLTGTIPSEIGRLQKLLDLQLYDNRLSGKIPDEIYGMLALLRLELSENDLIGTISTAIGRLISLTDFRVARNALSGTIPTELAKLSDLRILWLHMNRFEGEVPQDVCANRGVGFLEYLNADCGPEENPTNPCICCTGCCDRMTEICRVMSR